MLKASELKIGDTHSEVLVEDLKRTQIVQYAGASGDYNPLHTDEIFTTKIDIFFLLILLFLHFLKI